MKGSPGPLRKDPATLSKCILPISLFPKQIYSLVRVTVQGGKGHNEAFPRLLETISELTQIPGDPGCHRGPQDGIGAYESEVINGVSAELHLTGGTAGTPIHPVVISQVQNAKLEYRYSATSRIPILVP